jgi:hypothetical protein
MVKSELTATYCLMFHVSCYLPPSNARAQPQFSCRQLDDHSASLVQELHENEDAHESEVWIDVNHERPDLSCNPIRFRSLPSQGRAL